MLALPGARRRTSACLLAFAIALVAPSVARADDCPFADSAPGQATPDQLASATVCLLNQQRAANGLGPLTASQPLADTATKYAAYMVSNDHFAHQDESGGNVVNRVLADDPSLANRWVVLGENLGWGSYSMATPRSMVTGWMNSPTHRDNILYPDFDEIGVGTANGAPVQDKSDALTYATVFGKIDSAKPASAKRKASKKHRRSRRAKSASKSKRRARAARHHAHH